MEKMRIVNKWWWRQTMGKKKLFYPGKKTRTHIWLIQQQQEKKREREITRNNDEKKKKFPIGIKMKNSNMRQWTITNLFLPRNICLFVCLFVATIHDNTREQVYECFHGWLSAFFF